MILERSTDALMLAAPPLRYARLRALCPQDLRNPVRLLDVQSRVVMRVLRHAEVAVTMEVYANASATSTREALRKLGESLV